MSLIDEKWLSAYLDGELDADGCRRVEGALRSDAGLRLQFREMQRVRGWVGSLSRPVADSRTSAVVLGRIGDRGREGSGARIRLRNRPVRVLSFGMALAAVAALYIAMLINPVQTGGKPGLGAQPGGELASSKGVPVPKIIRPVSENATEAVDEGRSVVERSMPGDSIVGEGPGSGAGDVEALASAAERSSGPAVEERAAETPDVLRFRDLIAGEKRLVRIVVSGRAGEKVDPDAVDQEVRDCPRQDPRYGRFNRESGELRSGFAFVGDRVEVDLLLSRLRERFGGSAVTIEQPREGGEEELREALTSSLVVERGRKALPRVESATLMHSQKVEEDLVDPAGPREGYARPGSVGAVAGGLGSAVRTAPSRMAVLVVIDEEGKP